MASHEEQFKKLIAHTKEYGFIFPSSEIYDGLAAVYDYAQYGVELKRNIRDYWWKSMVQMHENIVGLDSAVFMHPTIWKASGHVDAFNDPMIDNKDSKKRYRADVLIEDQIAKWEEKIEKEVAKAAKRFGDAFDREQFVSTNPRVLEYRQKIETTSHRMNQDLTDNNLEDLRKLIEELEIVCPISGSRNWTDIRQFNLMFATKIGSVDNEASTVYLRPETAQGIFVNFLNVQKTGRMKIPFGIAQTGKAFRNEIVARQFIFRMREFEQMEMQFFGNHMVRILEAGTHEMAPLVGHPGRKIPFPRPRETGALRQRGHRHRIRIPVRLQGTGRHPLAHRLRFEPPSGVLRQENPVLRPRPK